MKRCKSILLSLLLLVVFCGTNLQTVNIYAATRYTTAPSIYEIVRTGYNGGTKGPISIVKGTYVNGTTKNVYLVTLSGTELVEKQSTSIISDVLSGFELDNSYYKNGVQIVTRNIPYGSNIIFAGHSLGGMVAQQLAADSTLKAKYNILYTLCFGSPLIADGKTEGTITRLGDYSDVVPYLSSAVINNTSKAIKSLKRENGKYYFNVKGAHCDSYARNDVWGRYDVAGVKGGNGVLNLDLSTQKWYLAPSFEVWFN